jgi:uncharacterized membrane protein YeiH
MLYNFFHLGRVDWLIEGLNEGMQKKFDWFAVLHFMIIGSIEANGMMIVRRELCPYYLVIDWLQREAHLWLIVFLVVSVFVCLSVDRLQRRKLNDRLPTGMRGEW